VAKGSDDKPDPETVRKDPALDGQFTDVYGRLRETMNLRQCRQLSGTFLASYIHHDGKSGVVVALDGEPKSDKNVAADLCMHTLFTNPIAIDRSGVPADQVEKVRSQAIELAQDEGKNESITAKIADGKVNAFYAERVLTEQLHVKTDDYGKTKIGEVLKQAGVGAVTGLVVMKVGE
jgi:elongation factor Ts